MISVESVSDAPTEFSTASVVVYVVPAVLPGRSLATVTAVEPAMPPLKVHA